VNVLQGNEENRDGGSWLSKEPKENKGKPESGLGNGPVKEPEKDGGLEGNPLSGHPYNLSGKSRYKSQRFLS
jgi:hypothetical protein